MKDFRVYTCRPSGIDPLESGKYLTVGWKGKENNVQLGAFMHLPYDNFEEFIDELVKVENKLSK
jgi:hypothetical protein